MKESEIRPKELFKKYLDLSLKDAEEFDKDKFFTTDCVFCGSKNTRNTFVKHGFKYQECNDCRSLFCNPRPSETDLSGFYSTSASAKFWFDSFLPKVEESRRIKMFAPKAKMLIDKLAEHHITFNSLCDCGAGSGIFLEELRKLGPTKKYSAIEPGEVSAQILKNKGIIVLDKTVENSQEWAGQFDAVTSLEVLEHVYSPHNFVKSLYNLLSDNGFCLVTTLCYDGFDIQILKENSNSVSPPHHLNFPSVKGIELLLQSVGFSNTIVFTPGKLDVDIVLNSDTCPDFLRTIDKRGEGAIKNLQKYLVEFNLSSHLWVIGVK